MEAEEEGKRLHHLLWVQAVVVVVLEEVARCRTQVLMGLPDDHQGGGSSRDKAGGRGVTKER